MEFVTDMSKINNQYSSQESEGKNFNFYLSKIDNELFDDKKNNLNDLWNIKRKENKKDGVTWIIFKNKEIILEILADKFSNKEKKFLNNSEGLVFLLSLVKTGVTSFTNIKSEIKRKLKE